MSAPGKGTPGFASHRRYPFLPSSWVGCLPCALSFLLHSGKVVSFVSVPVFLVLNVTAVLFPAFYISKVKLKIITLFEKFCIAKP